MYFTLENKLYLDKYKSLELELLDRANDLAYIKQYDMLCLEYIFAIRSSVQLAGSTK